MTRDGDTARYHDPEALAEWIIGEVGPRLRLAIPLGVGKPNQLVNALYRRVQEDSRLSLDVITALTLEPPAWSRELERRLVQPLAERVFEGYPELDYARDARAGRLPDRVRVREFYIAPGARLGSPRSQQDHVSTNYSQVARDVADRGVNVVAQLVSPGLIGGRTRLSLGSNPDVTWDLLDRLRERGESVLFIGQVNRCMPFMQGDALVDEGRLDALLDDPSLDFPLVGPPREPVSIAAHAMGLYASCLVPDGGTLQLGIGAVADAITWALALRHERPGRHRELTDALEVGEDFAPVVRDVGGRGSFDRGLYACTEMFVPGYLDLYRRGILHKRVTLSEHGGSPTEAVLRAAFFLGPRSFYEELGAMEDDERALFRMMRVSFTNRMASDPETEARHRESARHLNSAMMISLLGEAASDTLGDGRTVSGVGGQHDFVTLAHRLPGARSVLLIPSTRHDGERLRSNIRPKVAHGTVPRHLRDLVVTEYGVVDLRGRTDGEVVQAMLSVTDVRFQEELAREAREAGKLPADWHVPDRARRNHPDELRRRLGRARDDGTLPELPFGSDLTAEEIVLGRALKRLAKAPLRKWVRGVLSRAGELANPPASARPYLERMGLDQPKGARERAMQVGVVAALVAEGAI